jgi:hypothetical protein
VTVEGPAHVSRERLGEQTTEVFTRVLGEPPAEPLTDDRVEAMGRVVLVVAIEKVYGASYLEPAAAP